MSMYGWLTSGLILFALIPARTEYFIGILLYLKNISVLYATDQNVLSQRIGPAPWPTR